MIETCCIPDPNVLTSLWDGLSSHLIASFWEVKKSDDKKSWVRAAEITVKAPLSESNMEMQLTWSSPFEGAGLEKGMPTVAAMLQSGSIQPYLDSVGAGSGKIADFANTFEGRTGITKMNSTQVFTGMPPVKIQVTAVFRAWRDSANEVEAPFDQLMKWALPKKLADEAAILNMAKSSSVADGFRAMMPSLSPTMIAMKYKGRIYSPLVIESIGQPMNSPIDKYGKYAELSIPMTLCTLTAIDRDDWAEIYNGERTG